MNTLKLAMRSFAKATSHLFIEVTPEIKTATPSTKVDDESGIDEMNGILLDQLFKMIGKYLASVGLGDNTGTKSKSFTTEEINNFVQLLTKSADVPVTAAILQVCSRHYFTILSTNNSIFPLFQSNRYKNLTKNIRQLSKGKGKEGIAIDPMIQVASSKV